MGEEIIIYSDDGYKPAPRDLGANDKAVNDKATSDKLANDKTSTKKLGGNRLGDTLDTELHANDTDTPEPIAVNNDDLWQRIRNGYAIPDSTSSLVARHEEWYSTRPDYIKRMVERSQKYLFHIVEEVEKRGMPTEIALLPMIESAYNPQANSTSSASGIWQFVPATGKHFGLKQNWWVDNRRNVTFATDAALTYLQKLHTMFGAWDLALAAYNAGEGTVGRAIERNRKLGLPTDYESLDLPAETKNYVPKLQAIKNLMTNPENYGLKIQTIANTPYFAKVTAPAQIDAHLAAKLAEISDDEFLALNPSNKRPVITSNGEKHELLLPILSAQTFRNNLAGYDKP
ncbi:MAG: transglycosylase SLT domain-containing protein, partial [Pseudomonadota bacterium]